MTNCMRQVLVGGTINFRVVLACKTIEATQIIRNKTRGLISNIPRIKHVTKLMFLNQSLSSKKTPNES